MDCIRKSVELTYESGDYAIVDRCSDIKNHCQSFWDGLFKLMRQPVGTSDILYDRDDCALAKVVRA